MVSVITLAKLSTWTHEYLAYLGWFDNPIIERLYTLTSAGVWIARTDTSGRIATVEQNSDPILSTTAYASSRPLISGTPSSGTNRTMAVKRMSRIPVVLDGAGQALNTVLVSDPATAHFPVLDGFIIKPNAGCAIAGGLTMGFESPAGTAIETIVTAALVENVPITTFADYPLWVGTDNEALVVDITGAGGAADAAKTMTIIVFWHYET